MSTVTMQVCSSDSALVDLSARMLSRELLERAGVRVMPVDADGDVTLSIDPTGTAEGYAIARDGEKARIVGSDSRGLLYGVGRFLHESVSADGSFAFCGTIPFDAPACSTRGMYFAHNFHNWYRSAPMDDLIRYVEDLALWGLNAIVFPAGTNPQCPAEEMETVMLPKQLELMTAAKECGISVGMLAISNGIWEIPDPAIAATPVPDPDRPRRGNVGNRICPSTPAGMAALEAQFEKSLARYADVGLDFVMAFPYDEGGCGCECCWPWGARGYVEVCKTFSGMAKERFAGCRFYAVTWCFDAIGPEEGEFEGLDRRIREDPSWCDGIMCDSHGTFPLWPREHGAPGGLPMVCFPEISMWGRWPWGGYGANPYPQRIASIWHDAKHLLSGGFPYSEGRFEDINKVMCLSLFWDKDARPQDVVRKYVGYELGRDVVEPMARAISRMEDIYPVDQRTSECANEVLGLIERVQGALTARGSESWRWRILYLRAVIDAEACAHPDQSGIVSERQQACFEELTDLYCANGSESAVRPPRRK